MNVEKNAIVSIDYTLRDGEGELLDTSDGGEPLEYLHGGNQIVPGLEKALDGHAVGDKLQVEVSPEAGYGERDEEAVVTVPRDRFPPDAELEEGMSLVAQMASGGMLRMRIVKLEGDHVVADLNHPLAGRTLRFDVTVRSVRAATPEELSHGHAHGCAHCHGGDCEEHEKG